MRNVTPFQEKVYQATSMIPVGKVTTYKLLAQAIACNCPQAVGQALKHNPFAPQVPCHRVVNINLCLHGFQGSKDKTELSLKRELLLKEGVLFDSDDTIAKKCLFTF